MGQGGLKFFLALMAHFTHSRVEQLTINPAHLSGPLYIAYLATEAYLSLAAVPEPVRRLAHLGAGPDLDLLQPLLNGDVSS